MRWHLNPEEMRELAARLSRRSFQAEGIANAKALRLTCAWWI